MIADLTSVQIPRIRGKMVPTRYCFDDCIATFAKYKKCDYELMYLSSWDISWSKDENQYMINRMQLINNFRNDLYEYCGIKLTESKAIFEEAYNTISEPLNKKALIIIYFDSYYCPWDRGYHRYNSNHAFFVEGIDIATKSFICTDPYFEINHGKIAYEDFKFGHKGFATIEHRDTVLKSDISKLFENKLKSDSMHEYFVKIREWANEFSNKDIVKEELFICDGEKRTDIINIFLDFIDKRTYFLILVKYIARTCECNKQELEKYETKLLYIIEQWNLCQAILTKGVFRNNPQLIIEKVPNRLMHIIEMEEEVIKGLISILEKSNHKYASPIESVSIVKDINRLDASLKKSYYYVNLESYFNNEGIGYENSVTADLTSANEFILLNSFFSNGILNANNMSFMITKKNNAKDNISCTNQMINIEVGYYKKIMLLGCSEWGSFSDSVIVFYLDGTQETINLFYFDFTIQDECNEINNISFECKTVKRIRGENELCDTTHFLYAKAFNINFEKKVKRIILPACPCIHIFAISFL